MLLGLFQQDTSPTFLLLALPKKQCEVVCGLLVASLAQRKPYKLIFSGLIAFRTTA